MSTITPGHARVTAPVNVPVDLAIPALAPLLAVAWWSYTVCCQFCTNPARLVVVAEVAESPFDSRPVHTLVCDNLACWDRAHEPAVDVSGFGHEALTREMAEHVTGLDLAVAA